MERVDARGLSCPEPVILTRRAIQKGANEIEVLVDNVTSRENVTRSAEHAGYKVDVTENDGEFTLNLRK